MLGYVRFGRVVNCPGGGRPRGGISPDGTPGERLVRFIVDLFRFATPALILVVLALDFERILAPKSPNEAQTGA